MSPYPTKTMADFERYIPEDPPIFVYVAAPITKGPIMENVGRAMEAANELLLAGLIPIVPHLTVFWNWMFPPKEQKDPYRGDHELWLPIDFAYLKRVAHVMLRLPGESTGADNEAAYMQSLGKPVFGSSDAVIRWSKDALATQAAIRKALAG